MKTKNSALALLSILLTCVNTAWAAESHRVLIRDIGRWPNNVPGSEHHRLLVLEMESGKVLAQREIGGGSDLALSPKGDVLATISTYRLAGSGPDNPRFVTRVEFFQPKDLKPLESGLLPPSLPRFSYQQGAASDMQFSPDGQELIVPGATPGFGTADLATTELNCLTRELDSEGYFKLSQKAARIPRCHGVGFLRVADWPRVHIWNPNLALLEVVDLQSGKILSRLLLANDPALAGVDPVELEHTDYPLHRMRGSGWVTAAGGRYAYFLPNPPDRHPSVAYPTKEPGFLKQIDLTANPPKVVRTGEEPQPDLGLAIVCEPTSVLAVKQYMWNERFTHEPSRRIKIFSIADLKLKREIDVPLNDCLSFKASRDGKYLYAWDREEAKLAVIEIATGREVKVLDGLGKYPDMVIALPDRVAEE